MMMIQCTMLSEPIATSSAPVGARRRSTACSAGN
jgi:hypothetical protein